MSMMLFQTTENELIIIYGHYLFSQALRDTKEKIGSMAKPVILNVFIVIYIEIDNTETALFKTQSRKILKRNCCVSPLLLFSRQKNTNERLQKGKRPDINFLDIVKAFAKIKAPERKIIKINCYPFNSLLALILPFVSPKSSRIDTVVKNSIDL